MTKLNESEWTVTDGRRHPKRPSKKAGNYFQKFIPATAKILSFRLVNIEQDLEVFHGWQNQKRVYDLWELNKPVEELREYLQKSLEDPRTLPLILEFDGKPAGYFEVYWAAEDRIAPFYDYDVYDRGFHFLIGEPEFLGQENTGAAVSGIMQFIFESDERTRRIVAEPRADNARVIKYARLVPGWKILREFDFPHKRAVLLMARREDFFGVRPV